MMNFNFIKKYIESINKKRLSLGKESQIVDKFIKNNFQTPSFYNEIPGLKTKIWFIGDYTIKFDRLIRGDLINVYNNKDYPNKDVTNNAIKDKEIITYVDQSYQYSLMGIHDEIIKTEVNKEHLFNILLNTDFTNKETMFPLIQKNGNYFQYCSYEIKTDIEFCKEALKVYKEVIDIIPMEVKENPKFELFALEQALLNNEKFSSLAVYIGQIKEKYKEILEMYNVNTSNDVEVRSFLIKKITNDFLEIKLDNKEKIKKVKI